LGDFEGMLKKDTVIWILGIFLVKVSIFEFFEGKNTKNIILEKNQSL
jgi:hypothetical protein